MQRDRAFRRAKRATKMNRREWVETVRAARHRSITDVPAEKNWKHVYSRAGKLARARQLGFDYPRKTQQDLLDEHVFDDG